MRASDTHLTPSASSGTSRRSATRSDLAKTVGARRDPGRVDAVHLADDARRTEAMNESDVVGLPLRFHLAKDREVLRVAGADPAAQLAVSGLYQVVERAALPIGRGLADIRRPVFDDRRLLDAVGSPTKRAAFVDRMQRVDQKRGTRKRDACAAAAVAEAVQRLCLRCAGKPCFDEPAFDAVQRLTLRFRRRDP